MCTPRPPEPRPARPLAKAALFLLLWVPGSMAKGELPLTSAKEVRLMKDETLVKKPTVRLRGVILRYWPGRNSFVLKDESDAIFINLVSARGARAKLPEGLGDGSLIELEGGASEGMFAPIVVVEDTTKIRHLGTVPLPLPEPLTSEAALAGRLDSHLVTAEGVVRRAYASVSSGYVTTLEMVFESTRLLVLVSEEDRDWDSLINARVRVTGISSGIWNKERQITAPCLMRITWSDIEILQPAPPDPFALPARSVAEIMRYRPTDTPGHRIRITGIALHAHPGGQVYVFDGERAVCVESAATPRIVAGDAVDVVGFPGIRNRAPLLEDAVLRVGQHRQPLPTPALREAGTILQQSGDYELVRMNTVLLETQRTTDGIDLLMQSGETLFQASYAGPDSGERLSSLVPGTSLSLTGLVLFSYPSPTVQAFRPTGFSLLLRSPSEVIILRQPSWWTVTRLLALLGAAMVLVMGFALWNHYLRARARVQQEIISAQARREATSEERARLARELHDTLEQEFVGMTRQTEALEHAGPLTAAAKQNLDVLRQMLQLSRENARRSVWDLRDPALFQDGIEAAIRSALQRIIKDSSVELMLQSDLHRPEALPAQVQINALRLAQEAVTNAVKHSAANHINVRLHQHETHLELTVADDGHGKSVTDPEASSGHFGILGMKERCEKLGGRCDFESTPAGGATVRATIPL